MIIGIVLVALWVAKSFDRTKATIFLPNSIIIYCGNLVPVINSNTTATLTNCTSSFAKRKFNVSIAIH
jgi:hypothetical protein